MALPLRFVSKPRPVFGIAHLASTIERLSKTIRFEEDRGRTRIVRNRSGLRVDHALELADQPDRRQGLVRRWPRDAMSC